MNSDLNVWKEIKKDIENYATSKYSNWGSSPPIFRVKSPPPENGLK